MQFEMEADTLLPVSSQPLEKKKEKKPQKLRAAQKIKRKGGGGCWALSCKKLKVARRGGGDTAQKKKIGFNGMQNIF